MNQLDALVELAYAHAATIMIGTDHALMPIFAAVTKGGVDLMGCPWRDDSEKELMMAKVKDRMRKSGATAYSFVTEAWAATQDHPYGPGDLRPAERPDRREIVVACATDGKNTVWRQWGIERNARGECVALPCIEIEDATRMESWLASLLS